MGYAQLVDAAGRGVSTPAARAECGVSSGAAKFGDVFGAAERGLAGCRRWRGVVSGVVYQIRTAGFLQLRLLRASSLCEHRTKAVFVLKFGFGWG